VYTFKEFLLAEEDKKKPAKNKKKKTEGKEKETFSPSKDATHAGMSFYDPGECK
jgi:hypothetical protein